uniref:Retrovirus-related Pol polyprotein from transposon TNT 1-94 n=1 Tax=Lygus hesperus TaxID=30085 RepID=A0A0A9X817_LYGHE
MNCATAAAMYNKLVSIFEQNTGEQKCTLLNDFFSFVYDSSMDMASNLSRLQNIVYSINSVDKDKITDEMLTAKIITILPASYNSFKSSWDGTSDDKKTIENLISRLIREAERIPASSKGNSVDVAYQAKFIQCFKCKGPHKARFCKSKSTNKKEYPPCATCKKTNHLEEDCFFKKFKDNKDKNNSGKQNKPKTAFLTQFCLKTQSKNENTWILDSGSSSHMTSSDTVLKNKIPSSTEIQTAKKGEYLNSKYVGTVETGKCVLNDVLHVPKLSKNLLSVNAITNNGGEITFFDDKVEISKNGEVILEGHKDGSGLYNIDMDSQNAFVAENQLSSAMLWHRKLAHLSPDNMKKLSDLTIGMELNDLKTLDNTCEVCQMSKQVKKPFQNERSRATRPIEIIHTDVGEVEQRTWDNKKWYLTCLDDYTHFAVSYLLEKKSEVFDFLKIYVEEVESKWNSRVHKIRCDHGGEYSSNEFKKWCETKGIQIDYTNVKEPQLNGRAERLNRTLMNKTRALLFDSSMEKSFWGEALLTSSTYLLNRSPTNALIGVTPAEKWFGKKPNLKNLQIFGATAYFKDLNRLKKLDSRSKKGILVGYCPYGYRIWDPFKKIIVESRNVRFDISKTPEIRKSDIAPIELILNGSEMDNNDDSSLRDADVENPVNQDENIENLENPENQENNNEEDVENEADETGEFATPVESEEEQECLGRGKRIKRLPVKLKDFVMMSYHEAVNSEDKAKWIEAINEEKEALASNNTWKLVNREEAKNKKILTSRWVFKVKDDGRYRARLVVRGCQQRVGIDFDEVFSPVVGGDALRVMLAHSAKKGYHLMKFDVKTAFLYGTIKEELYMEMPDGYSDKSKICKLEKALYGLHQAPACWNKRLTSTLQRMGLKPLKTEQCVFVNVDHTMFLAVHVDDGIIAGKSLEKLHEVVKILEKEFKVIAFENPDTYLGLDIIRTDSHLKLSQKGYAEAVIRKYRMDDAKPALTPIASDKKPPDQDDGSKKIAFPYREAVGSLLYLSTKTRPDLALAVGLCGRHVENPRQTDVQNIKRTLKYVKATADLGVNYIIDSDCPEKLVAYCDADFAGDVDSRKSTTGFVIFYSNGPVSWTSRKQPIVATSSTESEYISAAECARTLIYLRNFLEELSGKEVPTELNIDNQSAMDLINNGVLNRRSKHIDVRYHYIKEKVDEGLIQIKYCPTETQIADILTKPLLGEKFQFFKQSLVK